MTNGTFNTICVVVFAGAVGVLISSPTNAAAADHHEISTTPALDPPIGNYVLRQVLGKGKQLYRCSTSRGTGERPTWVSIGAKASLFPLTDSSSSSLGRTGFHYFLPDPDAGGGKATWASTAIRANASTTPDSTVTGKVLVSIPSSKKGTIDSVLLEATGHTGLGSLSTVSYIQRVFNKGGAAPSTTKCTQVGLIARVSYQSRYNFWAQLSSVPLHKLLPSLKPPAETRPLVSFFGEGFQYYAYNGTTWNFVNVTAAISSIPGQEIVGRHYLLPKADKNGGTLSWETFYPQSIVTAVAVEQQTVDPKSITWVLLHKTSSSGNGGLLESIQWIQRVSTRNGLPPPSSTPTNVGDTYMSPFSYIYWFYVSTMDQ